MNQSTLILQGTSVDDLLSNFRDIIRNEFEALPKSVADKPFLTLKETSEFTGISIHTIYRMTSRKEIPHLKAGGKLLFDRAELTQWLNATKQPCT